MLPVYPLRRNLSCDELCVGGVVMKPPASTDVTEDSLSQAQHGVMSWLHVKIKPISAVRYRAG